MTTDPTPEPTFTADQQDATADALCRKPSDDWPAFFRAVGEAVPMLRFAARLARQTAWEAAVDSVLEGRVVSVPLRWKLPLRHDGRGYYIFDADDQMIAQIRGWGHLTGAGGLGLNADAATAIQVARAQAIVDAVNAHEVKPTPDPEAR